MGDARRAALPSFTYTVNFTAEQLWRETRAALLRSRVPLNLSNVRPSTDSPHFFLVFTNSSYTPFQSSSSSLGLGGDDAEDIGWLAGETSASSTFALGAGGGGRPGTFGRTGSSVGDSNGGGGSASETRVAPPSEGRGAGVGARTGIFGPEEGALGAASGTEKALI